MVCLFLWFYDFLDSWAEICQFFFVCSFEKFMTSKGHSEINWPLGLTRTDGRGNNAIVTKTTIK